MNQPTIPVVFFTSQYLSPTLKYPIHGGADTARSTAKTTRSFCFKLTVCTKPKIKITWDNNHSNQSLVSIFLTLKKKKGLWKLYNRLEVGDYIYTET